jgi:hypothetical protein
VPRASGNEANAGGARRVSLQIRVVLGHNALYVTVGFVWLLFADNLLGRIEGHAATVWFWPTTRGQSHMAVEISLAVPLGGGLEESGLTQIRLESLHVDFEA